MKRIFLILFAVLLTGGMMLQAEPVSADRALEVAKKALPQPATKASGDLKLIWNGENAATKAADQPAFYVFGRDAGGFVIIAGDDNVQPVLAISETNRFEVEGMPENVKWWMERMETYVRNTESTQQAREQWARFAETKSGPAVDAELVTNKVEKLTPEWDQGNNDAYYFNKNVFNAQCPKVEDVPTLTGCVATALGEILTFQSGIYGDMPTFGTGTVGGYDVDAGYVAPAPYSLGTIYDWANLRTLTNIEAIRTVVLDNSAEGNSLLDNLGRLLADLGAMVEANYSVGGTGANTAKAISGLGDHLGYNKAAYYARAADYAPSQWVQKLKKELDERPFLYDGVTAERAGHAFVFDGYGTYGGSDLFHVNFGWGGACNGYYYYYELDAQSGHDYSYDCGAIFDLYPAPTSSYTYNLMYANSSFSSGLSFVDPFDANDDFRIKLYVKNTGSTTYSGKLKFKLLDKSDNLKADFLVYSFDNSSFGPESDILEAGGSQYYIQLPDDSSKPQIEFGDKIVVYCSTNEAKDVFAPIMKQTDGTVLNDLPLMPAAFIKTNPSGYTTGDYFQLELMNYDTPYAGTVWKITPVSGGTPVVLNQAEREYQFPQSGTYKIEAAVAPQEGESVVETIVTYIQVD